MKISKYARLQLYYKSHLKNKTIKYIKQMLKIFNFYGLINYLLENKNYCKKSKIFWKILNLLKKS